MSNFLQEALNAASGEDFEEQPVGPEEFCYSDNFLALRKDHPDFVLSHYQFQLIRAMSQIYKRSTLEMFMGAQAAKDRWEETKREIIMQLGKGSGKDFTSTIGVSYVVYLLLCLKDPARYFGKPSGDAIDIINIAINADQAQRVFFANFMERIKKSPWFEGRYEPKINSVKFDKNVNVYSGHSEREAYEGYNTLMVILDEISGFAMDSDSGNHGAKTAPAIYKMYRGSVTSRFAEFGKLVMLSFPRYEDDFIQTRYKKVIEEKETIIRSATLKRDAELPDGIRGNEFEISWEEDHIVKYKVPRTFALRRPSWEVNPTKDLQVDYAADFDEDMGDALGRFACMPSNLSDGFFKNAEAVEAAFSIRNGVDGEGVFAPEFKPKEKTRYFMHVDLAQKHDYCAVAMAHVDSWKTIETGSTWKDISPVVKVDAIRWWTPTASASVKFSDVVAYIKSVRRRGFDLQLVTFDRWNSHDTMLDLNRSGIDTELLSVAKKHYDDFKFIMYDERLVGPHEELLIKELGELRIVKDKIDHPAKGSKDLSDATCGAIFNAVSLTKRDENMEVDVWTLDDLERITNETVEITPDDTVIRAPKKDAPDDIQDLLKLIQLL